MGLAKPFTRVRQCLGAADLDQLLAFDTNGLGMRRNTNLGKSKPAKSTKRPYWDGNSQTLYVVTF